MQIGATAGIYVTFSGERYVKEDIEFLVVPAGCSCTWVPWATGKTDPGLVRIADETFHYAIGRKTLTEGGYAIAKVVPEQNRWWWSRETGVETSNLLIEEVLVCTRG